MSSTRSPVKLAPLVAHHLDGQGDAEHLDAHEDEDAAEHLDAHHHLDPLAAPGDARAAPARRRREPRRAPVSSTPTSTSTARATRTRTGSR